MNKSSIKGFICGVLLVTLISFSIPTFAQNVEVLFNVVSFKVNGNPVTADSINYNGKNYVAIRDIATLCGKDVIWDGNTKTVNVNDKGYVVPTLNPSTNTQAKDITIIKSGYINKGTTTIYAVLFSDNFVVTMGVPKGNFKGTTYEYVYVGVNMEKVENKDTIKTPSIIGFSDTFKETYYPLDVNTYMKDVPDDILNQYKNMDFFQIFSKSDKNNNIGGFVVYDSFVKLEGVTYDDGVHKCKMYLQSKSN